MQAVDPRGRLVGPVTVEDSEMMRPYRVGP
jgi:hypothetical protein